MFLKVNVITEGLSEDVTSIRMVNLNHISDVIRLKNGTASLVYGGSNIIGVDEVSIDVTQSYDYVMAVLERNGWVASTVLDEPTPTEKLQSFMENMQKHSATQAEMTQEQLRRSMVSLDLQGSQLHVIIDGRSVGEILLNDEDVEKLARG